MVLGGTSPREQDQALNALNQFPPIASIWRRLGAVLVDSIILGILGQIIGVTLVFVSLAFQLGPYGRFIGFAILLGYFGTLNSSIAKGQTLGKRLLKIGVRGGDGKTITLWRSSIRGLILVLPGIFNGWQLPGILFPPNLRIFALAVATVFVFGIGSALVYTMLFNLRTRQGIHDLICNTYVVSLSGSPIPAFPQTRRTHLIISGILIGLSLVAFGAMSQLRPADLFGNDFSQLQTLQYRLLSDERFFSASVLGQNVYGPQTQLHILSIEVWYKGLPSRQQRTQIINAVATSTFETFPSIDQFDRLRVGVLSKYDLGIAEGHILEGDIQPISVWKQRLGK